MFEITQEWAIYVKINYLLNNHDAEFFNSIPATFNLGIKNGYYSLLILVTGMNIIKKNKQKRTLLNQNYI